MEVLSFDKILMATFFAEKCWISDGYFDWKTPFLYFETAVIFNRAIIWLISGQFSYVSSVTIYLPEKQTCPGFKLVCHTKPYSHFQG